MQTTNVETNKGNIDPGKFAKLEKTPKDVVESGSKSRSAGQEILYRLYTNSWAMVSLGILLVIVFFAIFGPSMSEHNFYSNNLDAQNLAPSGDYWFGTDSLGRDIWSRTWKGAQISLTVGLVAALADLLIGVLMGGMMGYFGGKVDEILNRFSEVLYAIPYLLVVILVSVVLGSNMWTIILAMTITGWINMSWIVRGQIMQLKNQEYVLAARSMGAGGFHIVLRHLIPNSLGPIIVTLTLSVPSAIFAEAFLSFLGLGVQSPAASWGVMINDAMKTWKYFPWQLLFPAGLLTITMLAFNIFGDGLRDAFDPKMKV
ncbi:ABC transporter permease [Paenibacillus methanolicus]|uniref:Oligopeptide transport system permease protein n=1 Tax=Paenibacillus methanolicus TaxID=582686 RepID=A0A5S5CAQ1_9BACL|nr:ABC transporter permease [Paenibacillus methanolicus]TYP75582.1 oligopeptide transport system permease protein [Paenibacillus methanolicus]